MRGGGNFFSTPCNRRFLPGPKKKVAAMQPEPSLPPTCPAWMSECVREELEIERRQRNHQRKHGLPRVPPPLLSDDSSGESSGDDKAAVQRPRHLPLQQQQQWMYETPAIQSSFCQPCGEWTAEDVDELMQEAEARANGTLEQYELERAQCEAADPRRHAGRSIADVVREAGGVLPRVSLQHRLAFQDLRCLDGLVLDTWEERILWGTDTAVKVPPPPPPPRSLARADLFGCEAPEAGLLDPPSAPLPPPATDATLFNIFSDARGALQRLPPTAVVRTTTTPLCFSWLPSKKRCRREMPPLAPPSLPRSVEPSKAALWGCIAPHATKHQPHQPPKPSLPLPIRNPQLEADADWSWLTKGIAWDHRPSAMRMTSSVVVKHTAAVSANTTKSPEFRLDLFNVSCDQHYQNHASFLVHEIGRNERLDHTHADSAIELNARWYSTHWTPDGVRVPPTACNVMSTPSVAAADDASPSPPLAIASTPPIPTDSLVSLAPEPGESLVMFEYLERDPLVLCNQGMISQVTSYVRDAVPANMSDVPGQVVRLSAIESSPLSLGDIPAGVARPTQIVSNRLFSAPIVLHQATKPGASTRTIARSPAQRDMDCTFLLVPDDTGSGWIVQALPPCFCVGQLEPNVVVPRPSSPEAHSLHQKIIKSTLLRRFLSTPGARVRLGQMLDACGAEHETLIRSVLKETCVFDRAFASWSLDARDSSPTPNQLHEICTPEHW
jgi:hypothetical protein